MYRMQLQIPSEWEFDIIEVLSDVMDTQLSLPANDGSSPKEEFEVIAVGAQSLKVIEALKKWRDAQKSKVAIYAIVGSKAITFDQDIAALKAAIEKASAG